MSGMTLPSYLSSHHHPLFEYHRWKANLRVLGVEGIETVPYVQLSHPFVERLTGTVRRKYLDHVLFWNATDLERKLEESRRYYNDHRVHASLDGDTPAEVSGHAFSKQANLVHFRWRTYCPGLVQLPLAA